MYILWSLTHYVNVWVHEINLFIIQMPVTFTYLNGNTKSGSMFYVQMYLYNVEKYYYICKEVVSVLSNSHHPHARIIILRHSILWFCHKVIFYDLSHICYLVHACSWRYSRCCWLAGKHNHLNDTSNLGTPAGLGSERHQEHEDEEYECLLGANGQVVLWSPKRDSMYSILLLLQIQSFTFECIIC